MSLTLAGRLIGRIGVGAVAATGAALYVVGIVIWLCRVGPHPDYVADFLPGQLFTAAGVGLVFPSLSAVTGLALPAHRWGAGSALTNTARQLGTVLGTAVLTMIYQPGIDLGAIRRGWEFMVAAAGTAALIAAALALWRTTTTGQRPLNDEIPERTGLRHLMFPRSHFQANTGCSSSSTGSCAALQAQPPQLKQHSTRRRVDEVVPQRDLDDRIRALRDGDEARRVVALQLVQPHPVDRHHLVRRGPGIELAATPDHHRRDDISRPGRVVVEHPQHRRIRQPDTHLFVKLPQGGVDSGFTRIEAAARQRPLCCM